MAKKKLTKEEVLHIAELCNLNLDDKEITKLSEMLADTLDYVDILAELETNTVPETYQVTGKTNVFQNEEEKNTTLNQKEALANAGEVIKKMFATKAVFEDR